MPTTEMIERDRPTDAPESLLAGLALDRTVNADAALARFGKTRVTEFSDAYCRGDEIGYRAWKSMGTVPGGRATGRAMFNAAIAKGIDSVANAPDELVALFQHVEKIPGWVDWEQLRRGAIAYWRPGKIVAAALVYGGYGAALRYGGTRPLLATGRALRPETTGRRLMETLRWVVESTTPDGMKPHARGFELTMHVRMIHASVREFISKSEHWPWNDWGVPINSADALYQSGGMFCAMILDLVERAGWKYSAQEREDVFALWRYLGHVMGVPEDLNYVDEADMRAKMDVSEMLERKPDEGCRELMAAMLDFVSGGLDEYQMLPSFIETRLSDKQRRVFNNGMCRAMLGDDLCEQFGIPDSKVRYLLPAARPFIVLKERIARSLPHDDEAMCRRMIASFGDALILHKDERPVVATEELRGQLQEHHSKVSGYKRERAAV